MEHIRTLSEKRLSSPTYASVLVQSTDENRKRRRVMAMQEHEPEENGNVGSPPSSPSGSGSGSSGGDDVEEGEIVQNVDKEWKVPLPRRSTGIRVVIDPATSVILCDVLAHKHDSPKAYLRVKAFSIRRLKDIDRLTYRLSPEVADRLGFLWEYQRGRCAFTGREMLWKKEDIDRCTRCAATIACVSGGGDWTVDTAILVCNDVHCMISRLGFERSREWASWVVRFDDFRRKLTGVSFDDVMSAWDDFCCQEKKERKWEEPSDTERRVLHTSFLKRRLFTRKQPRGYRDPRSVDCESAFSEYCTKLYCRQRGR